MKWLHKHKIYEFGSVQSILHNIIYYQMATLKPFVSRYTRKQNYESIPYPPPSTQTLSPLHVTHNVSIDHTAQKKSIQQKQIQDLEQKVDLILAHNDKLTAENIELKKKLADADIIGITNLQKERMSRYLVQDNQYTSRKIKSQLQIKSRDCEVLAIELEASKEAYRKQIEGLRIIISNLTVSNDEFKLENIKLAQDILKLREQFESDKKLLLKEQERKQEEALQRAEKDKIEQKARERIAHSKVIEELTRKFEGDKEQAIMRKNNLISKLQENHNKEINELREHMMVQFQEELRKLEEEATQRCKNQKQKAEKFIKECLDGMSAGNEAETESLKLQIKTLHQSLQNRKRLINEITSQQMEREDASHLFDQIFIYKQRLNDQIEHLMRENELLKIRTAQKYERDLKQMVKIYEDKIQILTAEVRHLTHQNDRLRTNYEEELEMKIKQRRNWEVEAGQLKNLVRKLKVQLKGIQDEFRLNIDGLRDQNTTFSMTLMKSMVQDRDKANFFEEENRKLRDLYEKHESEVEVQKKQAQQKVKFYEDKLGHFKRSLQGQKEELAKKEEMLQAKLAERQNSMRQYLRKQKQHLQEMMASSTDDRTKLERALFDAEQKCGKYEAQIKQNKEDIDQLTSKIKENEAHIERLRMELEMAGVDDREKDDAINHWKDHYEGIILKLESDKLELKQMIDSKGEKIERLVYKYRLLEDQLRRASEAVEKRGLLDKKIMELGLDDNLVKNMAEMFKRVNV